MLRHIATIIEMERETPPDRPLVFLSLEWHKNKLIKKKKVKLVESNRRGLFCNIAYRTALGRNQFVAHFCGLVTAFAELIDRGGYV